MVEQYTEKVLTRSEDRLPAIWALAQRFRDTTGNEYCSGLWKEDLLTGLLFKRFPSRPSNCRTNQLSRGPSWSWAYSECKVKFQHKTLLRSPMSSSSAGSDCLPKAFLQRLVIVPTGSPSFSMGRTSQAELEIRTLARIVVGWRPKKNPHPEERVAEAMGISRMGGLHSDVWRQYERLEREYESSHGIHGWRDGLQSSSKNAWIRERTQGFGHAYKRYSRGTDCYFGWSGARFIEEERWKKTEESRRREGDKVLNSGLFELDFDTQGLAKTYEGKSVTCLHIEGRWGLLVEPDAGADAGSQTYRRIGIYSRLKGTDGSDKWEPKIVALR